MFKEFKNRYLISGKLVFQTPFHIGSGGGSSDTDSTVVKYMDDRPYIPGSSFKGILRSNVERLAPTLNIDTCQLFSGAECDKIVAESLKDRTDFNLPEDEERYAQYILNEVREGKGICKTCRLFGCTYLASKVYIEDLLPLSTEVSNEIRDGVGIDRDTGTAVEGVKYDYEVVPKTYEFQLKTIVENVDFDELGKSSDLFLLSLGLSEFVHGTRIGGLTSRGLGVCRLHENSMVYWVSVENHTEKDKFIKYIKSGAYPSENCQVLKEFINTQLDSYLIENN